MGHIMVWRRQICSGCLSWCLQDFCWKDKFSLEVSGPGRTGELRSWARLFHSPLNLGKGCSGLPLVELEIFESLSLINYFPNKLLPYVNAHCSVTLNTHPEPLTGVLLPLDTTHTHIAIKSSRLCPFNKLHHKFYRLYPSGFLNLAPATQHHLAIGNILQMFRLEE